MKKIITDMTKMSKYQHVSSSDTLSIQHSLFNHNLMYC